MSIEKKIRELEYRLYTTQQELEVLKRQVYADRYRPPAPQQHQHRNQQQPHTPPFAQQPNIQPNQQQLNQQQQPMSDRHHQNMQQQTPQSPPERPTAQRPNHSAADTDWEHLIAKVWLPRVFVFVLILGVLWAFIAAVTNGLITEPVRVILGVLTSVVMAYFAVRQINEKRPILGHVLLGGAIAIATLSVFAAHLLYDLVPLAIAFILYALTFGLGLYAGFRFHSQTVVIISTAGAFLIPFLVGSSSLNPWVFALYEALFSVGLLYISLKYRYVASFFVTFFSLHLSYFFALFSHFEELPFMIGVLLQHAMLLYVFYSDKKLNVSNITMLYVSFGLTVSWLFLFYDKPVEWFLLGFSLAYTVLSLFALEQKRPIRYVVLSIATFSWFLYFITLLDAAYLSLVLIVQGTIAFWLGQRYKSLFQQISGLVVFSIGALFTIVQPIEKWISYETLAWLVMVGGFYALYHFSRKIYPVAWLFLAFDSFFALMMLTQLTSISTEAFSSDIRHLAVSFVWILYAILIVWVGIWKDKKSVRLTGVLFLFFTLLKVIFYDLPDVSMGIRAILFIVLGFIGLLVSRFFYKKEREA